VLVCDCAASVASDVLAFAEGQELAISGRQRDQLFTTVVTPTSDIDDFTAGIGVFLP
jgi:hypothetical protein